MRDRIGGPRADLNEVRRQLSAWRAVYGGRGRRLPEEVWAAAVRLARNGDAGVVARALRLNPKSLWSRMAGVRRRRSPGRPPRPAFVELSPRAETAPARGCRVELSSAKGSRISIQFADATRVDLVALAGGLLGAGR
jgi:transposase-like protein